MVDTYTDERKEIEQWYQTLRKKKYTNENYPDTLKSERKWMAKKEAIARVRGLGKNASR